MEVCQPQQNQNVLKDSSNSAILQRTKKCMCLNFDGDNNISKISFCSNCQLRKSAMKTLDNVEIFLKKIISESALLLQEDNYKLKTKSGTCLKKNLIDFSSSVIREIFINPVEPIKSEIFEI